MIRRRMAVWLVAFAVAFCSLPAGAQTITPQGRLTLTSGTPVMTGDVVGATTIYYDCYAGNTVPVGATPTNLTIPSCETSMGLSSTNIASGSVYDVFAVSNSGALVICAGPAWSSTTTRGTGSGTTQIDQTNGGLWTNTNALAHCYGGSAGTTDYGTVAANAGTYLGSLYATAAGQTTMQFAPTPAGGGTANILGLYNAHNRVPLRSVERDSHGNWSYGTDTWRPADNSTSNRITWLDGLGQSQVSASYANSAWCSPCSAVPVIGVDFNSATAIPGGIVGFISVGSGNILEGAGGNTAILLGVNYAQAMEIVDGGTADFVGGQDNSSLGYAGALSLALAD